jgi:ATP-binding protein involved in chromosome partitioning
MAAPDSLETSIRAALREVEDPELHQDLVSAGMVREIRVDPGGRVHLDIELTTPACPLKDRIEADVRAAVEPLAGVTSLAVAFSARVRGGGALAGKQPVPGVAHVVAVASGKGGVGKSTLAVNVATALAMDGARVGLLDCDIYGPSVPLLVGLPLRQPEARDGRIVPFSVEKGGARLEVMSMAFFMAEDQAVIWRGPMLHKAIQQFLFEVEWGELDYLVVDLPPGTGDAQLSLSQVVPLTGALIVTTPQDVALLDVKKAVSMFDKVGVPVLGVVENMAYFRCPDCGTEHPIFGRGGGQAWAEERGLPFLGAVPLDMAVRVGGDRGEPAVARAEPGPAGDALRLVARALAGRVSVQARQGSFAVELPVVGD